MSDPLAFLDDELRTLRDSGVYRWPRELTGAQAPVCVYDGRRVINLCANNYLGLADHPALKAAAREAIDAYGVGSGAVRTIAGNMAIHDELERRLAAFKRTEAALLYQSGFAANAGTVSAVLGKGDVVVSDALNHASIIDGCRLSGADRKIFPHKDLAAARRCLEEARGARRVLLITDGVFSMDGDVAPLPELCALAREFGAIMMVDDAHASGVMGAGGRGTVEHFGMHDQVDIQVGTLSKAWACLGGYVAGRRSLIEFLMQRARPLLFSTSHPPSVAATAIAALDLIERDPAYAARPVEKAKAFARQVGLPEPASPIVPIVLGEAEAALAAARMLEEHGFLVIAIRPPTVPRGTARLRLTFTAQHPDAEIARLAELVRTHVLTQSPASVAAAQ